MTEDDYSQSSSPFRWVLIAVLFIAAFMVVKFVFGIAMTLLKWALIAVVAGGLAIFVARKLTGD